MSCKAKELGEVNKRGSSSAEWFKEGKAQYYCRGYYDIDTECLIEVCSKCSQHVDKAQGDLDLYNSQS